MNHPEIQPEKITSRANPTVVRLAKLSDKKYRDADGLFLLEGEKLVAEALAFASLESVLITEAAYQPGALRETFDGAMQAGARGYILSEEAFAKISTEKAPQGIIGVARRDALRRADLSDPSLRLLILDQVNDPGNIGTILRSAAAFGVDGVLMHDCADLTGPKTVRATMGALFKLSFAEIDDTAETVADLRAAGRRVFAAALTDNSETLGRVRLLPTDVAVIGNEGHGLDRAVIDACTAALKIPMAEGTESLNASVAASVILWEQYSKS